MKTIKGKTPLRLALLWHMHQPHYLLDGEARLPWVRLHAVKDYYEMLRILEEYPQMRCTINFVPSLLLGIRESIAGRAPDRLWSLLGASATDLDEAERDELAEWTGRLPKGHMIAGIPFLQSTLEELADSDRSPDDTQVVGLQSGYLLAWIGEIARHEFRLDRFLAPGFAPTIEDRDRLFEVHRTVLASVPDAIRSIGRGSRVEFSTSPFYHPILPILFDASDAEISNPNATMPTEEIAWPEDATLQLEGGRRFASEIFAQAPTGCWPSEGSVSETAIAGIAKAGFRWTASDQRILERTVGNDASTSEDHFFPWSHETPQGTVTLFFRDNDLSDRIGFRYSSMSATDAVDDFLGRLEEIRESIIANRGISGLQEAVVSVILDGENCWEHYERNGRPFLDEFYSRLSQSDLIEPVTYTDVLDGADFRPSPLTGIHPGSWIGGNFDIWIGSEEKNRAWTLLSETRRALFASADTIDRSTFEQAYEHLLVAQGSDWFWWYGPHNSTANDRDFDEIFRANLGRVYEIIGADAPPEIDSPIETASDESGESGGTMRRALGR